MSIKRQKSGKGEKLTITNLRVFAGKKEILKGISLSVRSGEVHAIMGPNGSGKSTFAQALMGCPQYTVRKTGIWLGKRNIVDLPTDERAGLGLFLAFQSPVAIAGVGVLSLLRTSYQETHRAAGVDKVRSPFIQNTLLARRWRAAGLTVSEFMDKVKSRTDFLHIDRSFLERAVNDGFSGGEKKKSEMLQALVLSPKFAIFDEIDTGLDVDALKVAAAGILKLQKGGSGIIIITHYQRILRYIKPDFVHVLVGGRIVESGKADLAKQIEKEGYGKYINNEKSII
ncbi:Fe-S cluster assembly ATPase SufC [Patescibacteria group bacterium]|nr:Fe-S cluster assembly ATPase SufC [Patescibacteria group bacterium]MBU1472229.1 Fe-S cluster assembly ATPase SufC [Patescibacteria group bacterium]MBU2460519.1 Fe-S cluster assembly ATPase SufC [Patescibacteria group bacterium]